MVTIEVLGPGCAKCKRLAKNAKKALKHLKRNDKIVKIEDMSQILERGIMMTPALYIDGESKAVGKVPSAKKIKKMLQETG